jgi:nicotinamidase/pyrazinamidase
MKRTPTDALLVIDVQNDFCPGGALPVPHGEEVVPVINRISPGFSLVVATQDWHPKGHLSFASSHAGRRPLDTIEIDGITQVLWPDHCVQASKGAALHPDLDTSPFHCILRKGRKPRVDSYSAFYENDLKTRTGLEDLLKGLGVRRVSVCGLATDYCVLATARDARHADFSVVVIEDACRGVDLPKGSLGNALRDMRELGVVIANSKDLE